MITKERKLIRKNGHRAVQRKSYPYIAKNSKILNGVPIIDGTRISVATIAGYFQLGMSVDEILGALQHLTQAQIHSALAYYFDHQAEVDKQIETSFDMMRFNTKFYNNIF